MLDVKLTASLGWRGKKWKDTHTCTWQRKDERVKEKERVREKWRVWRSVAGCEWLFRGCAIWRKRRVDKRQSRKFQQKSRRTAGGDAFKWEEKLIPCSPLFIQVSDNVISLSVFVFFSPYVHMQWEKSWSGNNVE